MEHSTPSRTSLTWFVVAVMTAGFIEALFLLCRFKFRIIFPSLHAPAPSLLLAVLIGVLSAAFYHLPWSFAMLTIAAFVPCDLSAGMTHALPVSPIDYICLAAFIAVLFRLRGALWSHLYGAFGPKAFYPWTLFLVYCLVCAYALHGNARNTVRWMEFLGVFFLAILIPYGERPSARLRLARLVTVLGGICAVWAIAQWASSDFRFIKAIGPFGQHNALGGFLSLCFPASVALAYSDRRRGIFPLLSVLIGAGLLVAFSRGAIVGLLIGTALLAHWMAKPGRRYVIASYTLIVLLILGALVTHFHKLLWANGRNTYLIAGVHILHEHPWIGLGPGNYRPHIAEYLSGDALHIYNDDMITKQRIDFWQHLHNLYLQTAVDTGLIGLALWGLGMFFLVRPLFAGMKRDRSPEQDLRFCIAVSVLAYLLHNTVDILFSNNLETILAFYLALYYNRRDPAAG